jgi:NAD(P)H-hydrate epimerase
MILLSAAESREFDRLSTQKYGIPSFSLMTRAGEAVARAAARRFADAIRAGVIVVAGKGNNGGDGFVAARKLHQDGVPVRVALFARSGELKGDAARAHAEYIAAGGAVLEATNVDFVRSASGGLIIDALLGTGLNAEVRGLMRDAIDAVNASGRPTVAVDLPSGLDSDTGAVMGVAVKAALTLTFGCAKYAHVSYPGTSFCGTLEIMDIGFPPAALAEVNPAGRLIEAADASALLAPRRTDSHKGIYGHALIIAGGRGKAGAALLAARGALRAGAGLVTAAIPEGVAAIVATGQAELMTEPMPERDGHFDAAATIARLSDLIPGKSALIAGPGIGVNNDSLELVRWLIREAVALDRPLLLDADGLNILAELGASEAIRARGAVVLTPHPGEMARLLGATSGEVNANRIAAARKLAREARANVLLKGARSVIVASDGAVSINSRGNPGMATAGMGDVLSGIVGALMAQGHPADSALKLGVFVHGFAADRVAARVGRFGYLAGEIAAELPSAFDGIVARA